MIETASANPEHRILVDLAAQTHHPLALWMEESGVLELAEELGLSVCYWNVMDSGKDCVDLLSKLLDQFGNRLNYVLVQNQLRDEQFTILETSGVKDKALGQGARIISLKRLHTPVMTKIDSSSSSFWAAKNKDADSLNPLGFARKAASKNLAKSCV